MRVNKMSIPVEKKMFPRVNIILQDLTTAVKKLCNFGLLKLNIFASPIKINFSFVSNEAQVHPNGP